MAYRSEIREVENQKNREYMRLSENRILYCHQSHGTNQYTHLNK